MLRKGGGKSSVPVWALFILLAFLGSALTLVTSSELREAQNHRLRLLAGFSEGLETLVPDLVVRFLQIVDQYSEDLGAISSRVDQIPQIEFLGCAVVEEKKRKSDFVLVAANGPRIHLSYYRQEPDPGCKSFAEARRRGEEGRKDEGRTQGGRWGVRKPAVEGAPWVVHRARIDLASLLRPILIPDIFDSILVADEEGQIVFQEGEPELRIAHLRTLLPNADKKPAEKKALRAMSNVFESFLADSLQHVFLQPASLRFQVPAENSFLEPATTQWLVGGVTSRTRLVSSSLTTSPFLLWGILALFPLAFVVWPFLKLWLISPRQRFSRLDLGSLLISTKIGVALLVLLIFGMVFAHNQNRLIDRQLSEWSDTLAGGLERELSDAHEQLRELDLLFENSPKLREALKLLVENSPKPREAPKLKQDAAKASPDEQLNSLAKRLREEKFGLDLDKYPLFHSIFWADAEGGEFAKLPLRPYATLPSRVKDRGYFACALEKGASDHRMVLPAQALGSSSSAPKVCVEAIRSKTTAQDLLALSISSQNGQDLAAVLTTELHSLTEPVMPRGFEFVVLGRDGKVLFHSDRRRSLIENFFQACEGESLLQTLVETRRRGPLNLNYLGQQHRAHLRPLNGLPWALVTLRGKQDLRMQRFEALQDFLNPFTLEAFIFSLLCFALAIFPRDKLQHLWPDSRNTPVYRRMVQGTPFVICCFTLFFFTSNGWALCGIGLVYGAFFVSLEVLRQRGRAEIGKKRGGATAEGTGDPATCEVEDEGVGEANKPKEEESPKETENLWMKVQNVAPRFILPVTTVLVLALLAWWMPQGYRSVLFCFLAGSSIFLAMGWVRYAPRFAGLQRRIAYEYAHTGLVFMLTVLPALVFTDFAISRQNELAVADLQVDLARSLERRWQKMDSIAEHLQLFPLTSPDGTPRNSIQLRFGPRPVDKTIPGSAGIREFETRSLANFLGSKLRDEENFASAADDWSWLNVGEGSWWSRLLAARPFATERVAFRPSSVDHSRFRPGESRWRLTDHPFGTFGSESAEETTAGRSKSTDQSSPAVSQGEVIRSVGKYRGELFGSLSQRWNSGEKLYLSSSVPALFPWPQTPEAFSTLVLLLLLCVAVCFFVAYFISEKILLVRIVPVEQDEKWTLERLLSDPGSAGGAPVKPRKFIAINSVPYLALDALKEPDSKKSDSNLRVLSLDESVDAAKELKADETRCDGSSEKPLFVFPFQPNYVKAGEADKQLSWLANAKGMDPLILVSRSDPRVVFSEDAEELEQNGAEKPLMGIRRRWASLLACFVVRYVSDAGDSEEFSEKVRDHEKELRKKLSNSRTTTPTTESESTGQILNDIRLLGILERECRPTRQLQNIGYQILHYKEYRGVSDEQLLTNISFLARSYYHAIWAGCEIDEKVMLAYLADGDLINPRTFDRVHDLMQKGLIVRKPSLRLMNKSFGRFIRQTVRRDQLLRWEGEDDLSTWTVIKWTLPVPLMLLAAFLFFTQRDLFSSLGGVLAAFSSVVPTVLNLYGYFQRHMVRKQADGKPKKAKEDNDEE